MRVMILCVVLAVAGTVAAAVFWKGGTMEAETTVFIPQYISERPVLQRIFDPYANDFGTYQARELSYFFDWIDAIAHHHVTGRLFPTLFIPATGLLVPLLMAVVFAGGVRKAAPNLDAVTTLLIFALFLSSFVFVSTVTMFYRSGKLLLALFLLAYLFRIWRTERARRAETRPESWVNRDSLFTFAMAMACGLIDRQGPFYMMAATAILGLHYAFTKRLRDILGATFLAVVVLQVYNILLAPLIIYAVNNYRPSYHYQKIPLGEMPAHVLPAARMVFENFCVMLGGSWPVTLLVLSACGALAFRVIHRYSASRPAFSFTRAPTARIMLYCALALIANWVMYDLMIARHKPIYALDHRYWYYPLPLLAIILVGLVLGLNALVPMMQRGEKRMLNALLIALVIGNVVSLSGYRQFMLTGEYFAPVFVQSDNLRTFVRTGTEDPTLSPKYRQLGDYIRGLQPNE